MAGVHVLCFAQVCFSRGLKNTAVLQHARDMINVGDRLFQVFTYVAVLTEYLERRLERLTLPAVGQQC